MAEKLVDRLDYLQGELMVLKKVEMLDADLDFHLVEKTAAKSVEKKVIVWVLLSVQQMVHW